MEIKAGPELDMAVAAAIGEEPGLPFSIVRADAGQEGFTYKRYSTDLNAAFAAAEKVDLFGGCSLGLGHPDGRRVWIASSFDGIVSEGTTPALAICAAILKLKGTLS